MKILWKKIKKFYLFSMIIFILTLKFVKSDISLCERDECKSILMDNKIIFIKTNDNKFYYYDFNNNRVDELSILYNSSITNNKNILKLNDDEFVIFGYNLFGRDQIFIYQIYLIINHERFQINLTKSGQNNLNLTNIAEFNAKVIAETKKLIFSGHFDLEFAVYLYDLEANNFIKYEIPKISYSNYDKKDIRCDSIDGNNFLCVYYYQINKQDLYDMYYVYGNFNDNNDKIIRSIDSQNGLNGNVKRINDHQYLLCYQDKISSNFYVVCRYYTYNSNSNYFKEGEEDYRFNGQTIKTFIYIPLIMYNYRYSNIILYDIITEDNKYVYICISSLNFKIKLEFKLFTFENQNLNTINFFNDEEYIYHISYNNSGTYLKRQELIKCKTFENRTLSNLYNTTQFNFIEGTDNFDIRFSINDNLYLIPPRNKYEHSPEANKTFIFKKGENAGIFDNYYIYSYTSIFSLVCSLNITSCHSLCENCTYNLGGTDENNYCTKCINGYNYKENDYGSNVGFNCYKEDELMMYYYDDSGKFKRCNETCKYCDNPNSCKSCVDGYYFKYESNIKNDTTCFTGIFNGYYLSTNENIPNSYKNFKEIIDTVYKKCYETCETCLGIGYPSDNNCDKCKSGLKKYNFNNKQCLIDYISQCYNKTKFWDIKDNNITCKEQCSDYIVLYGINKGQCVKNCTNFLDPNNLNTMFYTLLDCDGKNYCIPLEVCLNGKFEDINYIQKTCRRKSKYECIVNVFDGFDNDPFIHDYDTVKVTTEIALTDEENMEDRNNRMNIYKILIKNENYFDYYKYDDVLMKNYTNLLQDELNKQSGDYVLNDIYLVLLFKYKNFNITIYPIDVESFAYNSVISPNNLGFINFEKYLPGYNKYEKDSQQILLVILLERLSLNSSINDLNYYFYGMNKNNFRKGTFLNISELNLTNDDNSRLNIIYPLKSYYNNNSNLTKRNTENLVENIITIHSKDPNIELYNLNNPFFNDICFHFTSDNGTDLTLNDRRNEYYVNKSLCENNCYLEKLLINGNSVKSVCSCKFKNEFSFNENEGITDDITNISQINTKSISCIEKVFNAENIAKNPIFWVFLLFILFLLVLFLIYIFYGNLILKRVFHLETSENKEISEIKESVNINKNESIKKLSINSDIDNISINKKIKKDSISSSQSKIRIIPKLNINNKKEEKIPIDLISSNNDKSNPPKKILKKNNNIIIKELSKENNILTDEPSLIKKEQSSEISYDSIKFEKNILVENFMKDKIMLENNFINFQREHKDETIFNTIRNVIYQFEENEDDNDNVKKKNKYYSDIFDHNYKKKLKEKNKISKKLLGGENIFNINKLNKGYNSDNYEETKYNKNKRNSKYNEFSESEFSYNFDKNIISNFKISEKNSNGKKDSKNGEKNNNDDINNLISVGTKENESNKEDNFIKKIDTLKNENKHKISSKNKKILIYPNIKQNSDESSQERNGKENKGKMKTVIDNDVVGKEKYNFSPNKIMNKSFNSYGNRKIMLNKETKNSQKSGKMKTQIIKFKKEEDKDINNSKRNLKESIINIKNDVNALEINMINEKEKKEEISKQKSDINFIQFYWRYFKKRELILVIFINTKDSIPFFIRCSCFIFCLSFLLMINCLFLSQSKIHKKFVYSKNGGKSDIEYYFKHEFVSIIFQSFIYIIFKMIIIKQVLIKIFKVKKETKKILNNSNEKRPNKVELENLKNKRDEYLRKYITKSIIYFSVLLVLILLMAFICISYFEVFKNSINGILIGFFFNIIISFIFCAIISFIIISIYRIGKKFKNECLLSAYAFFSNIY